jgi:hypothetical protein
LPPSAATKRCRSQAKSSGCGETLRFYATPHAFAADAKRSRHATGAGFVEDLQDFHAGRKDDLHRFNAPDDCWLPLSGTQTRIKIWQYFPRHNPLIIGTVSALIADFKRRNI